MIEELNPSKRKQDEDAIVKLQKECEFFQKCYFKEQEASAKARNRAWEQEKKTNERTLLLVCAVAIELITILILR